MLLSLLLLSSIAVSANDVILVSDNQADGITALQLANVINGTVITTTWGLYNESVVSEIQSLNPNNVIIIGGNLAVVDEYITSLENAGLNVERIGGATRYDTNADVLLTYQNQIRNKYNNGTMYVVNGLDSISLNETMLHLRNMSGIAILSNGVNLSVEPERLHLNVRAVKIVENPLYQFNHTKLMNRFRNNGYNVSVENMPDDRVELRLQHMLQGMEMKINILKNQGINTTTLEQQLNEAKNLMNQNRYRESYSLILKITNEEMNTIRLHNGGKRHGRNNIGGMNNNTNIGSGLHNNNRIENKI